MTGNTNNHIPKHTQHSQTHTAYTHTAFSNTHSIHTHSILTHTHHTHTHDSPHGLPLPPTSDGRPIHQNITGDPTHDNKALAFHCVYLFKAEGRAGGDRSQLVRNPVHTPPTWVLERGGGLPRGFIHPLIRHCGPIKDGSQVQMLAVQSLLADICGEPDELYNGMNI